MDPVDDLFELASLEAELTTPVPDADAATEDLHRFQSPVGEALAEEPELPPLSVDCPREKRFQVACVAPGTVWRPSREEHRDQQHGDRGAAR